MAPIHGQPPPPLKAHTATLIRNKIWVIGGSVSGSGGCFRGVATFSVDSMRWSVVKGISGTPPPPIRAHTATAVGDAIFCFGGGDGSDYYNDVYKLNTVTLTWSMPAIKARPATAGVPSRRGSAVPEKPPRRRAHSAALWGTHKIVVFGGGNGDKALNDTWYVSMLPLSGNSALIATPTCAGSTTASAATGKRSNAGRRASARAMRGSRSCCRPTEVSSWILLSSPSSLLSFFPGAVAL
jgi:hypothetical protein